MKRLLISYLVLSGVLAHVLLVSTAVWHYQQSGKPFPRYLRGITERMRDQAPALAPLANAIELALSDGGLEADPKAMRVQDVVLELPDWRGNGANALRRDSTPRFDDGGQPIAVAQTELWHKTAPPSFRDVRVATVPELVKAIETARAGDRIVLDPGTYLLDAPIVARAEGTAGAPIVLAGADASRAIVGLSSDGAIEVQGAYWAFTDLIVRGNCAQESCHHVFAPTEAAEALTVRNVFVSGVRHLLASPETASASALIDGVTMVGGTLSSTSRSSRVSSSKEIPLPRVKDGYSTLCELPIGGRLCTETKLSAAIKKLPEFGLLLIRSGTYAQAAVVRRKGISIVAEPGARLKGKAAGRKAAIVSNADLTIDGLECLAIVVPGGNGACVRQQGGNLTLRGVHFHHSQMGLLTGLNGGAIRIEDSYFHDAGYGEKGGLGHNVYVNSGELEFIRSWSIAARRSGHEIKSRASRTIIRDSIIASANAVDSRLIDVPLGGTLAVTGSVLMEGPNSENRELIGYGLEVGGKKHKHSNSTIEIVGNTVFFDRPGGSDFLNHKHAERMQIYENVMIGAGKKWPDNLQYETRDAANLAPYPFITKL